MNQQYLQLYADFVVKVGVNVRPRQNFIVRCPVTMPEFAHACVRAGYEAGAKRVIVRWEDDKLTRLHMELAQEADPQIQIVNLGETEYAVLFEPAPERSVVLQGAKTAFVALVAFCGAAFAIMTFNNDANVTDVFGTLYRLIAGRDAAGPTVLDASYSVGLAAGILLFFNHFASWKITEDPTPIEVEMSLYEENLNKTIIQNGERKGADPDGV